MNSYDTKANMLSFFYSYLACGCDVTGSINSTCQKYGGQCYCKPGVTGRTCDQCIAGFYNITSQGCTGNELHF